MNTRGLDPVAAYLLQGLEKSIPPPEVIDARSDPNSFCEFAFIDQQTGRPIVQYPHHRLWQDTVWSHDRVVAWFPIEHGKTTQAKMALCRVLGEFPHQQFAFISSKQRQAEKVVASVRREIESNEKLRLVYPKLRPQRAALHAGLEQWGNTALRVEGCPRGTKDPSLAAYGLDGQILGSRLHGVIIDNGLDKRNTGSDHMREWARTVIEDEIIGRVYEGGFVWILDTAWFEDDYMHVFAKRPGWHSVKLDALEPLREGDPTLWPAVFPKERLDKRLAELGQTAFDRQYRNRPLSESMGWFKEEYWNAAYGRCPYIRTWDSGPASEFLASAPLGLRGLDLRTGLDTATRPGEEHDLTSACTVLGRGHRRQLIHLEAARLSGLVDILQLVIRIYRNLHRPVVEAGGHAVFVVEDNAAQKFVVDALRDARIARALGLTTADLSCIRVVGRTTTKQRRDQELGIQGLASALEMGRYDVAAHHETDQLREEMRVWHPGAKHYGDRLMSLWFADSALREAATADDLRVDIA